MKGSGLEIFLISIPSAAAAAISITETTGLVFARLGNINGNRATHKIQTIKHANGFFGFFSGGHFHKSEAFGSTCGTVYY